MPLPNSQPFTSEDAQSIIALVRRGPLQNMQEAEAVAAILARFAEWVNAKLNPPAASLPPEQIPTAAALRAAGLPVPDGHP